MNALTVDLSYDDRCLDHLAPLCELFSIPLLVTHETNKLLLDQFYPLVETIYKDPYDIDYQNLCERYDLFFKSTFWTKDSLFYLFTKDNPQKKLIYLPHGNSDKGHHKPLMQLIQEQDLSFLYGKHMIDRLKKQDLWNEKLPYLICGNYRRSFYEKHKAFYDQLAYEKVFSRLPSNKQTIFYAPTWDDPENSSSFFELTDALIKQLPSHINLLIKLHPMLFENHPAKAYFYTKALDKDNIFLIQDYPHIYSLLEQVDIYVGDFSSIGYDFLFYQKPMFFYDPLQRELSHPSRSLHRCGKAITKETLQDIYSLFESPIDKTKLQQQVYHYAFGNETLDGLRKKFLALVIDGRQDEKIL